ncbi:MAG: helix-turn-helix domain-containing protein [Planctomycetes bacterium]|nr:helix-turn-helix domain-containing protein [Planctomycetota bacterium]
MPYPHQYIKLTDEERKILEAEIKKAVGDTSNKRRRRLQIPYLSDQGWTFRSIMANTKFSYATVRRYIYRYRKDGLKAYIVSCGPSASTRKERG